MSTISVPRSTHGSVTAACATRLERVMLSVGDSLTSAAMRRMERRADRRAVDAGARDETRRDVSAAAHLGLLPR